MAPLPGPTRRALRLLADAPGGCSEALTLAHGFRPALIAELVQTRLASAYPRTVIAGGREVEVIVVWITDAGRVALARG